MNPMPLALAVKTVARYVCSNCWGRLEHFKSFDGQGEIVHCITCKDDTKGYVTKYFAERRRSESAFEKYDATRLLREMKILPPPERRALPDRETRKEANIRELGF